MDVYQNPHVLRELVDRFDESSARLYVSSMPSKEGQRISAMGTMRVNMTGRNPDANLDVPKQTLVVS